MTSDRDAFRSLCRADFVPLSVLLGVTALSFWAYWSYVLDDVFITLRYAENLLTGNGLTFNPGERVEGYTNFLWTVVSTSLVGAFGRENALVASKLLSAFFGVGAVLLTYAMSLRVFGNRLRAFVVAALLAVTPGFATNAVSGLETALFTFLLVAACDFKLQRPPDTRGNDPKSDGFGGLDVAFAVTLALAALTRPEGFYVFTVLMLFQLYWGTTFSRWVGCGLVFSAIAVPYLAWKLVYFGELLPNTYYAKPGDPLEGALYVRRFLEHSGWTSLLGLPIIVGLVGAVTILRTSLRERQQIWVVVFGVVLLSAAVISGGDWMPGFRFIVPALPFIYVVFVTGLVALLSWVDLLGSRSRALVLAVLLVAFGIVFNANGPTLMKRAVLSEVGQREAHEHIGRWLKQNGRPTDLVILGDLGGIAYYGQLRAVDYHGLVDPVIARSPGRLHRKTFEPRYLMDKRPRFIVLVGSEPVREGAGGIEIDGLGFADQRIFNSAEFEEYEHRFSRHAEFEGYLHVFERRNDEAT